MTVISFAWYTLKKQRIWQNIYDKMKNLLIHRLSWEIKTNSQTHAVSQIEQKQSWKRRWQWKDRGHWQHRHESHVIKVAEGTEKTQQFSATIHVQHESLLTLVRPLSLITNVQTNHRNTENKITVELNTWYEVKKGCEKKPVFINLLTRLYR